MTTSPQCVFLGIKGKRTLNHFISLDMYVHTHRRTRVVHTAQMYCSPGPVWVAVRVRRELTLFWIRV